MTQLPSPSEAFQTYQDAEKAAADAYTKYWLDLFSSAGIIFATSHHIGHNTYWPMKYETMVNGYQVGLSTNPSRFEGVRLVVTHKTQVPGQNWQNRSWVKLKSSTGFARFVTKLQRGFWN